MSIILSVATQKQVEEKEDKLLWLVLRIFMLATEVCVMAFDLLSVYLADAKASVKKIVIGSVICSMTFTLLQIVLEMQTLQSTSSEHYAFTTR